jgi:hypothetical protein
MAKFKDLTGQKFGKLTVIKRVERPKHRKDASNVFWLCKCECGSNKDVIVNTRSLKSGNSASCGCSKIDRIIKYNKSTKKKYNTYDLSGEFGIGYTTKGEEFYFDLEDYNKIKDICWRIGNKGYVMYTQILEDNKRVDILFHRLVMNCPDDKEVDHIYGKNTRNDNRKYNLRICTHQKNTCNSPIQINNTSGKTGVVWNDRKNKWDTQINYMNEHIYLGDFKHFDDAVKVRLEAEIKYFGEFRNENS